MNTGKFRITGKCKLARMETDHDGGDAEEMEEKLGRNIERMAELQNMMYAQDRWALLIVFQAMDAAGKDSAIRHVMSGLNPQGCQVYSFKQPSIEDLDHDYLWRVNRCLPERGRIGIFNRSHYEDVLVVRVHDLVKKQRLPSEFVTKNIWNDRYRQIRDYERHLFENGTRIVKFFLHVSKKEQKKRFLERIDEPAKRWKFSSGDLDERAFWDDYQSAYQDALSETSRKHAPWYVVPADNKKYTRLVISEIVIETMKDMGLAYPEVPKEHEKVLEQCRKRLTGEKD